MKLFDIPRNDVAAALLYWRTNLMAGTLRQAHVSSLFRLQDSPKALSDAIAQAMKEPGIADAVKRMSNARP